MDKIIFDKQKELEKRTANKHLDSYFAADRSLLCEEPLFALLDYIEGIPNHEYEYTTQGSNEIKIREDLIEIDGWLSEQDPERLDKILFNMMVLIISNKQGVTAQALAGMVFNKVDFEEAQRKLKLASIFMDAIATSPYVTIRNTKDKIYFDSELELPNARKREIASLGHPLPMLYPPRVRNNKSVGYASFSASMVAGGKLKQHDKDIVLDHFNRLNATEYCCELRIGKMIEPQFSKEAKTKDNGEWETPEDIQKRLEQFLIMKQELPQKIAEMVKHGNRFYIPHYGDNRIRTYAKAHHFNYQGAKFQKALIQFKHKELVKPEF